LYNVGMIFGALVLSPSEAYSFGGITLPAFGFGVYGLVYGVILGALLHLGIQIPGMVKFGFHWTPSLDLRNSGLVQALRLIAPRLLTMFGIQLIFILRDNFASRLGQVGGVSALTYGWMIMQVPETIIGTAIATALLPTLSEYAAKKEWDKFNEAISKGLSVMISLSLPIAGILALYIKPLVGAAFGFDAAGTTLLATTTQIYMLTLVGYVVQETLARAFYARLEPKIPLMGVGLRLVLYVAVVGIGFSFFRAVGAPVIAAGELAVLAEAGFLFLLLSKKSGQVIRVRSSFFRGTAALVVVGLLWVVVGWVSPAGSVVVSLLAIGASGLAALAIVWKDASSVLRL
jgi:putative peptidoglycan lipid II flippase